MREFFEWVNEYIDENFAHVFVCVIMMAIPLVVYGPLVSAGLWTPFVIPYSLAALVIGHFNNKSQKFKALNNDKSLWA